MLCQDKNAETAEEVDDNPDEQRGELIDKLNRGGLKTPTEFAWLIFLVGVTLYEHVLGDENYKQHLVSGKLDRLFFTTCVERTLEKYEFGTELKYQITVDRMCKTHSLANIATRFSSILFNMSCSNVAKNLSANVKANTQLKTAKLASHGNNYVAKTNKK
jgi:hypothetical protein